MAIELTVRVEGATLVVGRLQMMGEAALAFGGAQVLVGSALIYAPYVVQGTRAHVIYPRAKKALFWPGAAHPVRSVRHPGTRPNPFMQEALTTVGPQAEAAVVAAVEEVIAGSGGPQTLRQGLMKAGLIVQAEVQRHSPVKTGALRASFHTEMA